MSRCIVACAGAWCGVDAVSCATTQPACADYCATGVPLAYVCRLCVNCVVLAPAVASSCCNIAHRTDEGDSPALPPAWGAVDDRTFHFLQVSDMHLSAHDKGRVRGVWHVVCGTGAT